SRCQARSRVSHTPWRARHHLWRGWPSRPTTGTLLAGIASEKPGRPSMPNLTILGSGSHVPGDPVPNEHLARGMDTSAEWIFQRTGIAARHFATDGQGASDLALPACRDALATARLRPEDVDYILFNTMTPDYLLPGSGPLLGAKLGIPGVPALDLRQQCAAIPFSLQIAEGLFRTGVARTILLVGADVHSGFMPWTDWNAL